MTHLAILSPGYPDRAGGVRDHTHRLAGHWRARGADVHIVGSLAVPPDAVVRDLVTRGVRAVLIEYVPFLYARRGLSRFPGRLARAARAAGLRVVVFVHEPWVPPTRLPWLILSPLQRRQLRRLLAGVDAVVTPVPAWCDLLDPRTQVIYSGSNLGDSQPAEGAPLGPLPAPVVFSITASGLRPDWIAAAARAIGATPELIVIGTAAVEACRHPQLGPWLDAPWEWRGRLPADEAVRLLARAPLALAPFEDGASGRRTSLLAALSAGARLVTTRGHLFDPLFDQGPVTVADSLEGFVAAARRVWASPDDPTAHAQRRDWYRRHFDERTLDDRLLAIVLGPEAPT